MLAGKLVRENCHSGNAHSRSIILFSSEHRLLQILTREPIPDILLPKHFPKGSQLYIL